MGTSVGVSKKRQVRRSSGGRSNARPNEFVEQLSLLPIAVSETALPHHENGNRGPEQSIVRTEQFDIEPSGEVIRTITRTTGTVIRTTVGKVPRKVARVGLTDDELRRVIDVQFLAGRSRSSSTADAANSPDAEEVRVADMFGGCGAMSLGVAEACRAIGVRFRMAGAFEIDEVALSVFCRNFGGPEPRRDVEKVLRKRVSSAVSPDERVLIKDLGRVDVLVAGPPCQGHSNLNNSTRRRDPKNELYYRVARFGRLFKPKLIIVENVQAVLHDNANVVGRTRRALEKLGYTVDDAVVRLADIGVAQTRRRHILVAVRSSGGQGLGDEAPTIEKVIERFRVPHRSVLWAIGDLTRRTSVGVFDKAAKPSADTQRRIKWLFDNKAYELVNRERPDCQKGEHRYTAVYGRMRPDKPAPTITGGYDTMGRGRFVHPTRRRTITPHEAARIQFFPDDFDFSPAAMARARLAQVIGNAVPPKLSYALALELLR